MPTREAPAITKEPAVDLAAAAQAELDQRRADKAVAKHNSVPMTRLASLLRAAT